MIYIAGYFLSVAISYYLIRRSAIKGNFEPSLEDAVVLFIPVFNIIATMYVYYLWIIKDKTSVRKFFRI